MEDCNSLVVDLEAILDPENKTSRRKSRRRLYTNPSPLSGCNIFIRKHIPLCERNWLEKGAEELGAQLQATADAETTHIVTTSEDYLEHKYKFYKYWKSASIVGHGWLESCIHNRGRELEVQWLLDVRPEAGPEGVAIICELPPDKSLADLQSSITRMGGVYHPELTNGTSYLCASSEQVANLEQAVVRAEQNEIVVLSIEWLFKSIEEGKFVHWQPYWFPELEEEYRPPLFGCSIVVSASYPHSTARQVREDILKLGGAYQRCVDIHTTHVSVSMKDLQEINILVDLTLSRGTKMVDHGWLQEVIENGKRIFESPYSLNKHVPFSDDEEE